MVLKLTYSLASYIDSDCCLHCCADYTEGLLKRKNEIYYFCTQNILAFLKDKNGWYRLFLSMPNTGV